VLRDRSNLFIVDAVPAANKEMRSISATELIEAVDDHESSTYLVLKRKLGENIISGWRKEVVRLDARLK
jgi:hypothetical protein